MAFGSRSERCRQRSAAVVVLLALGLGGPALSQTPPDETEAQSARVVRPRGGLSSSEIQSAISTYRQEVRSCVFDDREGLPTVVEMTVQFRIGSDGQVQEALMHESNAGKESVESCILGIVDDIAFPAPADGRQFAVRYKFTFVVGS